MASVTITLPQLPQALEQFLRERFPSMPASQEVSQLVCCHNPKVGLSFSGHLTRDQDGLAGEGTITLEKNDEVCIYRGSWLGENLTFEEFHSEILVLKNGELLLEDATAEPYELPSEQTVLDGTHVVVENCPLEFPVLPGQHIRIPGPDGEYLEVDAGEYDSSAPVLEVCDRAAHRLTRSFAAKNAAGELLQGFLDVSAASQTICWSKPGGSEVEVEISLKKFKTWFFAGEAYSRGRNLLQALGLKAPLFEKKLPAVSPTTATAS